MFGQRFLIKADTIATASEDGNKTAFHIPAGAEIIVIGGLGVEQLTPATK